MIFYYNFCLFLFFKFILLINIIKLFIDIWFLSEETHLNLSNFNCSNLYKAVTSHSNYSLLHFLYDCVYFQLLLYNGFFFYMSQLCTAFLIFNLLWYIPLIYGIFFFFTFVIFIINFLWRYLLGLPFIEPLATDWELLNSWNVYKIAKFFVLYAWFQSKVALYILLSPGRKVGWSNLDVFMSLYFFNKPFWFIRHVFWITICCFEIYNCSVWKRKHFFLYPFLFCKMLSQSVFFLINDRLTRLQIQFRGSRIIFDGKKLTLNPVFTFLGKQIEVKSMSQFLTFNRWMLLGLDNGVHQGLCNVEKGFALILTHSSEMGFSGPSDRARILETKKICNSLTLQEEEELIKESNISFSYSAEKTHGMFGKQYVAFSFLGENLLKKDGIFPSYISDPLRTKWTVEDHIGYALKLNMLKFYSYKREILFQDLDLVRKVNFGMEVKMKGIENLTPTSPLFKNLVLEFASKNTLRYKEDASYIDSTNALLGKIRGAEPIEIFREFQKLDVIGFDDFCNGIDDQIKS